MSRQGAIATGAIIAGIACLTAWSTPAGQPVLSAAFWFEPVSYGPAEPFAERLSGGITRAELSTIESIARAEVQAAFANSRLTFTAARDAMYRIQVVQNIRSRKLPVAGEARPLPGRRGFGSVSFVVATNNAIAYAPADAGRQTIIDAIGRGIGRTAAHEFAHQLVGSFALHNTTDRSSYEYADLRPEHFYGELHWNVALPRLQERIGLRPAL